VRPAAAKGQLGRDLFVRGDPDGLRRADQSADALLVHTFGIIHGGWLRGGRYFETTKTIALLDVVFIPGVPSQVMFPRAGRDACASADRPLVVAHRIARGLVTACSASGR